MTGDPLPFKISSLPADILAQQLKNSERIFALLVASVKDYGIFMLDRRGQVVTWNEGAARIYGYASKEIIGLHFSILYSQENARTDQHERELEQSIKNGSFEEEGWLLKKDGTKFFAAVTITPVYENAQLVGFAVVTRDLSERVKADIERSESRHNAEVFKLLVNTVKDYAIFMLDPKGFVMTWNEGAQRIKGYSGDEIIGSHFSVFYPQEKIDLHHPEKELEIAKKTGRYEEEGWRVRKDGSLFWASVLITALFDQDRLVGFAKVTRDLTDRRNAEKARDRAFRQVAYAKQELERLAYSISHELQEPVAAITSYSKLLRSRYHDRLGPDANEFLHKIASGAIVTSKLVDDLWTYARVTRADMMHREVPTSGVLHDAKEQLSNLIQSRHAHIISDDLDQFPIVTGDREHLLFVFKELIANAIKHFVGPGCPTIEVSIKREHNGWSFNFRDNGPGIDRLFAEQAFGLYQRLNRKPDETGTGMGLAICKKIIEDQHKGRIGFESLEGSGSTFFFWIPDQPHKHE